MKLLFSVILCAFICSASLAQTHTLDHYLEAAQNNSPLLKDLKNQIASAKLDSMRLRAGLKPQVTGSSAGLFAPVVKGYGYAGAITNVQTFNALVGINKQLIGKNYLNSQLAAIALQQDSLLNSSQLSARDLKKTVIGQYITAYGSLQQLKFSQEVVDLLTKEDDVLKNLPVAMFTGKAITLPFGYIKAAADTAFTGAHSIQTDYTTLNYISGIVDTAMVDLGEPKLEKAVIPYTENNIFFQKFKLDSLRLANSSSLLDYSYKPKANIFADGGYNTDFTSQAYKNFGTSFGFGVSVPIYDGGQRKLSHKKIQLEERNT